MAVVVIAGSGRGVGKTAVGCSLIAAIPEYRWVAVKVTPHLHAREELIPSGAEACISSEQSMYWLKPIPFTRDDTPAAGYGIWEELDRNSEKDSGRYLAAGAVRSFLVSGVADSEIAVCVAEVRRRAADCAGLLVESNRLSAGDLAGVDEGRVSLAVLGGDTGEWKPSLIGRLGTVDAVVWSGLAKIVEVPVRHVFSLPEGKWFTPELVEFVRGRLTLANV